MRVSALARLITVFLFGVTITLGALLIVSIVQDDLSNATINFAFAIAFLALFLGALGTLSIGRRLKSIPILSDAMRDLSAGKLQFRHSDLQKLQKLQKSEWGELAISVVNLVDAVNCIISDFDVMYAKFHKQGETDFRVDSDNYSKFPAISNAMDRLNSTLDDIEETKKILLDTLLNIYNGNFTNSSYTTTTDLLGQKAIISQTIRDVNSAMFALLTTLEVFASKASIGSIEVKMDTSSISGKWKDISDNLNGALKNIHEPLNIIMTVMAAMHEGDFRYQNDVKYEGMLHEITTTINETMTKMSSYIDELDRTLDDISAGNLHGKIERPYVGTFDLIKCSVNSIISRLNDTVAEIEGVAAGVSSGALMLSKNATSLSQSVTQQMASVEEIVASVSEIDERSKSDANNALKAEELSAISQESAQLGNAEMLKLLEAMDRITESSSKISQIIKTIEDIAFQTNLLALNASVEASRAGENGKGFAVVANSVRSLAIKSSEAANETSKLIKSSIDNVNEGMKRATDTANSLEKIVSNVAEVSNMVGKIRKSFLNQAEVIHEIHEGMSEISGLIQSDAATSQETAAAAEELDAQVITLQEKLSFFQTRSSAGSVLSKSWVDSTLAKTDVSRLKSLTGTKKIFQSGETILYEGDTSNGSMYFLLEGHLDVYKSYGRVNQIMLATLKPGDLFGEMSLFLDEPRSATIVARETVEIMEITSETMNDFISSHSGIAFDIISTLCTRMKNMLLHIGGEV